jgi:hypothetical protein
MELADGKGVIVQRQLFGGRQFRAAVLETFPDLLAELGEAEGSTLSWAPSSAR